MENPTHSFREINHVLQLVQELRIKSKTMLRWSSRKKKDCFFVTFILHEVNFYRFISTYSVLNKLSE